MGNYRQDEWNKGEKEGSGGPLPVVDGNPIMIHKDTGKGTLNDPCVSGLSLRGELFRQSGSVRNNVL